MSSAPEKPSLPESSPGSPGSSAESRFSKLRGVRWRIDLGILPSYSSSTEDLRRVTADSRRRYASLRRQLLIDPKDERKSPDLVKDNPLSQNPDSMWGRFFRNAELEKLLDQDLSRLYPEQEKGYFQTAACQTTLKRILLLWCLMYPEYGYRQGMHELLAPLLYVLHIDVQYLAQVRGLYEEHFNDEFDGTSFPESDLVPNYKFKRTLKMNTGVDENNSFQGNAAKIGNLDELDPETRDIFLMTDAYGAEGELGVILSEKFMEHDAYCMFENLMNGTHGAVAMAEFFSPSHAIGSSTGSPPVLEASSALYHLLSIVDSSLHSHLIELGVEPQYFALRWLRVLFGREFSLEHLLVIWDEIFSSPNHLTVPDKADDSEFNFKILCSPRGAFISAMAAAMLLHLRSSLLASEHATSCLQRLLNFPEDIGVKKLLESARSFQALILDVNFPLTSSHGGALRNKQPARLGHSLSFGSGSPIARPDSSPERFWEEKWRVLHMAEEFHKGGHDNKISSKTRKGSSREKLGLPMTKSDLPPRTTVGEKKNTHSSFRHKFLDDLSQESDTEADPDKSICNLNSDNSSRKSSFYDDMGIGEDHPGEHAEQNIIGRNTESAEVAFFSTECLTNSLGTSPPQMHNEHEYDLETGNVTSNSFIADNNDKTNHAEECCINNSDGASLKDSEVNSVTHVKHGQETYKGEKQVAVSKEWRPLSNKFQWLRKFGRGSDEENLEKGIGRKKQSSGVGGTCQDFSGISTTDGWCNSCGVDRKTEVGEKKLMTTLRSLGQSMLENIQVIESVLPQDSGKLNSSENFSDAIQGDEQQLKAIAALKELRKISNLLSEM